MARLSWASVCVGSLLCANGPYQVRDTFSSDTDMAPSPPICADRRWHTCYAQIIAHDIRLDPQAWLRMPHCKKPGFPSARLLHACIVLAPGTCCKHKGFQRRERIAMVFMLRRSSGRL